MSRAHFWDFLSTTPLRFEMPKEEMDLSLRRYFSQMRELRSVVPQPDFVTTARFSKCAICRDLGVVLNLSCSHSACLECWISWANAQVESSLYCSHPSTVRCWGETCEVEMSNVCWAFLLKFLSIPRTQRWPVGELRLLQIHFSHQQCKSIAADQIVLDSVTWVPIRCNASSATTSGALKITRSLQMEKVMICVEQRDAQSVMSVY